MMLRTSLLTSSAAVALFSLSSTAHAADPCLTVYECATGSGKTKLEYGSRLQTSVDTGWQPSCNPQTSNGHCDHAIQFRAQLAIDPQGQTPTVVVDMPRNATVQVAWPTPDAFVVTLPAATRKDGVFRVSHTITPEIGLYLNVLSFKTEINLDSTFLLNKIPGAQFDYFATGSTTFELWGFGGAKVKVKGTDLQNSRLFSITFQELGDLVGTGNFEGTITGRFSFNALTDSDFEYKTTAVRLTGGASPITSSTGSTQLPMQDLDELDLVVTPEGTLSYDGKVQFKPVISITSVAGFNVTVDFPLDFASLDWPYGARSEALAIPPVRLTVPLPNVYVDTSLVDFGKQQTGKRVSKPVSVENTGKLTGVLKDVSCDDPQFTIGNKPAQLDTDEVADIVVFFRAQKAGVQTATCTVTSNDPDSPEQSFEVSGFGEGPEVPPDNTGGTGGAPNGSGGGFGEEAPEDVSDSGGCGCRTVGEARTTSPAMLGVALGAALMVVRRRRRRA